MRKANVEKIVQLQKTPSNIRNLCMLAHVDHGKTTVADVLVASNGVISQRMSGKLCSVISGDLHAACNLFDISAYSCSETYLHHCCEILKIRYMDSRVDEQERGITMKSSAISLYFAKDSEEYLINLIDSPGHVDFSSEVSTAVRLCDGAVIVVDVVEGVCPQTHAVLRQAWLENIKPVLLLNKVDRLITELHMEPVHAYIHLQQILEQVNVFTSELFTCELMEKTSKALTHKQSIGLEESDDSHIYFSPDQGNVIFASALDGWGFSINHFAELYVRKLGISADVLRKTLWGDFYLNTKTKRIMKGAQAKAKKPLFVQFVLENLWSVYDAVLLKRDKEMAEKIVKSLNLTIAARDTKHTDPKVWLQAICSQWLPLSDALLSMVVDKLPSPLDVSEKRIEKLMCCQSQSFDSLPQQTQQLKTDFLACSQSAQAPIIAFVSKMIAVDKKSLSQHKHRVLTEEEIKEKREAIRERHLVKTQELKTASVEQNDRDKNDSSKKGEQENQASAAANSTTREQPDQVFVAFARVFSGSIRKGSRLYVLGPKHQPGIAATQLESNRTAEENGGEINGSLYVVTTFMVEDLYLFMGRELELVDEVAAGNILGIGGLSQKILKSATVADTVACPAFTDMYFEAAPIVRVAIEPTHANDMSSLVTGLRLLNQVDPSVQVLVQESGEHVIVAAGEVHLQRCLDDLRERFCKIDINVSAPIVSFRETIINPPSVDMVNELIQENNQSMKLAGIDNGEVIEPGLVETSTANQQCALRIQAKPLPKEVTGLIEFHANLLKELHLYMKNRNLSKTNSDLKLAMSCEMVRSIEEFKTSLNTAFLNAGKEWINAVDQVWSFGPRHIGPNVLLNRIPDYCRSFWNSNGSELREFDNSIVSGFQMATLAGPMCEEPMHGVCFIIEKWEYADGRTSSDTSQVSSGGSSDQISGCGSIMALRKRVTYGPLSGQLMSCVKEGCRKAFQMQSQRLMAAMYKCDIQSTSDVLGKLYAVLNKRNGHVQYEDMREGSQTFVIQAVLPVVESFGFAEDIRKKTSGLAIPQLKFSHWEIIDVDPFWVPNTDEEYLHFGEKADSANQARAYMDRVRKRKGLKVDEKIVQHAEKQRTLSKNK